MRVCLVYDCLFPHTVGGAERWYRRLAERLAAEGHEVTYLTLRQWPAGGRPDLRGVRVSVVGPRMQLYGRTGRRRILPPLVFGVGAFLHLAIRGGRYDVVHTASFPYFSLLAAGLARRAHHFLLVVDWFESWTRTYWREYLGPLRGAIGWRVEALCRRIPQRAFCFAELTAARLRAEALSGDVTVLRGLYAGDRRPGTRTEVEPLVVFAGRHVAEKRPAAAVAAVARARDELPDLRGLILGDGPERREVLRAIEVYGLQNVVAAPGFVPTEDVEAAVARALCLMLPSRREGYGLVVIEAAARGTPSVVVREPDNAAVELIDHGINGFVAPSARPEDLAAAIVAVHEGGVGLRESTAAWFSANMERLSLDASIEKVLATYGAAGERAAATARS